MPNPIYELAIVGRITWDLHSLNNEGTLGNVTEPRTVMLADGTKSDGVSGEMLKHVHVQALWQIARDTLPLCSNCKRLEPNKANKSEELKNAKGDAEALQTAIRSCAICDLHGFLVEKPTINRSSCLEFGWAVGLPDRWYRDLHLHARHAVGERAKPAKEKPGAASADVDQQAASNAAKPKGQKAESEADEAEEAATSQMVYNRPTRSGQYAIVTLFAPWRIGLEHFAYKYVIAGEDRKARFDAAMRAYQAMFWRTDGAMTTTRLPHVEGFEGAVVISRKNLPVPTVSPLSVEPDYRDQLERLVATIGDGLEVERFGDMAGFVKLMSELAQTGEPFELRKAG